MAVLSLVLPRRGAVFNAEAFVDLVLHVVNAMRLFIRDNAAISEAIDRIRLRPAATIVELEEFRDVTVRGRPDGVLSCRRLVCQQPPQGCLFRNVRWQFGQRRLTLLGDQPKGENEERQDEKSTQEGFHSWP